MRCWITVRRAVTAKDVHLVQEYIVKHLRNASDEHSIFCEHHPHLFVLKARSTSRFSHYNPWWSGSTHSSIYEAKLHKKCLAGVHFTPCLEDRVCRPPCSCSVSQCVKVVCDILWFVLRISPRDFHQSWLLTLKCDSGWLFFNRKRNCCITVTFLCFAALQSLLKSQWGTNTPSVSQGVWWLTPDTVAFSFHCC